MQQTSILIIYTGGTIGMVHRPEDGSLAPVKFDQLLEEIPELSKFGFRIESQAFDPAIDSSNVTPECWKKIATTIFENYSDYDGFVILHGTDTMAYSASALSFMLENLDKPVILTGSQLPIGTLRTDGKENLITAVEIAAAKENDKPIVPEVCIYFDFQLFRGNRTTKIDSQQFSAFDSVNYPPLGKAGVDITFYKEFILHPNHSGILKVSPNFCDKVIILKIFPGMNESIIRSIFRAETIKGIIIESYGSGNVPIFDWLIQEIKDAIKRGVIFLNITQCAGGEVKMGKYETSIELLKAGVITGKDMTTEAAITKMMFLLGQELTQKEITFYLSKNLKGEITE